MTSEQAVAIRRLVAAQETGRKHAGTSNQADVVRARVLIFAVIVRATQNVDVAATTVIARRRTVVATISRAFLKQCQTTTVIDTLAAVMRASGSQSDASSQHRGFGANRQMPPIKHTFSVHGSASSHSSSDAHNTSNWPSPPVSPVSAAVSFEHPHNRGSAFRRRYSRRSSRAYRPRRCCNHRRSGSNLRRDHARIFRPDTGRSCRRWRRYTACSSRTAGSMVRQPVRFGRRRGFRQVDLALRTASNTEPSSQYDKVREPKCNSHTRSLERTQRFPTYSECDLSQLFARQRRFRERSCQRKVCDTSAWRPTMPVSAIETYQRFPSVDASLRCAGRLLSFVWSSQSNGL